MKTKKSKRLIAIFLSLVMMFSFAFTLSASEPFESLEYFGCCGYHFVSPDGDGFIRVEVIEMWSANTQRFIEMMDIGYALESEMVPGGRSWVITPDGTRILVDDGTLEGELLAFAQWGLGFTPEIDYDMMPEQARFCCGVWLNRLLSVQVLQSGYHLIPSFWPVCPWEHHRGTFDFWWQCRPHQASRGFMHRMHHFWDRGGRTEWS